MVRNKVITKVETPTAWVIPIVVVEKSNGKVIFCRDTRDLNHRIPLEDYPLKRLLQHYKSKSFQHPRCGLRILLDQANREEYVCYSIPYGRYKIVRLPFGISSVTEIFQRTISQIFSDIDGRSNIAGDIL